VAVERGLADPDRVGDVARRGAVEAAGGELVGRGDENPLPGVHAPSVNSA